MKILFVHQSFPGQFKFLAPRLAAIGNEITALAIQGGGQFPLEGVRLETYGVSRGTSANIHPWVSDFETKIIRAEACYRKALEMRAAGFAPDLIFAHYGWGESLFLKEVWPAAKLAVYCEFFYNPVGADVGFDPEFPKKDPDGEVCRLFLKNTNSYLHFDQADAGISPTYWQADSFPLPFRSKISVIHDGIDTDAVLPNKKTVLSLNNNVRLAQDDEVITFVNRNLEPYRGYHIFMRALPEILRRRPRARILIVGGSDVSYGSRPGDGRTWRDIFADEVRPLISDNDWNRVHFLGQIPHQHFISLLQVSSVHVYLTYPFVLSWSLLEAMSAGCAIVASATQPVCEVIEDNSTGRLVDFFDIAALVGAICELLEDRSQRQRLGVAARSFVRANYDLKAVCLPRQIEWLQSVVN